MLEQKIKQRKIFHHARITKSKQPRHVNLLYIQSSYNEDDFRPVIYHYCWIKDINRLLGNQVNKMHSKIYACDRCLHYFYLEEKLHKLESDCGELNKCWINMPQQVKLSNSKILIIKKK